MVTPREPQLRQANSRDLPELNAVIEAAVMGWNLPERVKRLALPSYRYDEHDLDHLDLWVAQIPPALVGVVALEPADRRELPNGQCGLLLHGLYVHPEYQHQGIGRQLLQLAEQQVRERQLDGLLVRAQSGAGEFFAAQGMQTLETRDEGRDYQYRYWKTVTPQAESTMNETPPPTGK
ncbi:GNAT family N-acetyltransferase [Thiohalophilus sp.]|uniref:GNAT family N-acetyltransferase n=1 Tax=Thiohalophilus sp. TaxID=3028392 RepID=UPI002ACD3646|nr:GNAT family N-acetyltransferase [Thiohalophilus sp.]MDZ7804576.1 GNAT family N-acetyltransferase [Thiohalophilus sp.]